MVQGVTRFGTGMVQVWYRYREASHPRRTPASLRAATPRCPTRSRPHRPRPDDAQISHAGVCSVIPRCAFAVLRLQLGGGGGRGGGLWPQRHGRRGHWRWWACGHLLRRHWPTVSIAANAKAFFCQCHSASRPHSRGDRPSAAIGLTVFGSHMRIGSIMYTVIRYYVLCNPAQEAAQATPSQHRSARRTLSTSASQAQHR